MAPMLVAYATAASCTASENAMIDKLLAANVSTSCAALDSWGPKSFDYVLQHWRYSMCHSPCKADLQRLTNSLPDCDIGTGHSSIIVMQNQICNNMTRPTTNGGACTTADSLLYHGLLGGGVPVWSNCSSIPNAILYHLQASTTQEANALCASTTCTAYINMMAKKIPNCVDEYGDKTMVVFQSRFGCTPATGGANCTMVDRAVEGDAYDASLWPNCSTFLNSITTFGKLDTELKFLQPMPSGFCASTCPANYLSVKKTLPLCIDHTDKRLSDPSRLYRYCPSLDPATPAPTPAPTSTLSCPLSGSYRATGMRMDLANSGAFTESHDASGTTCSTTGTYVVSDQTATLTVSTVSGVCSSVFTPNATLSGPISFSSDCQQLTLNYTGTTATLQRTSDAQTAATSAMLLLGVVLAWGAR